MKDGDKHESHSKEYSFLVFITKLFLFFSLKHFSWTVELQTVHFLKLTCGKNDIKDIELE